MSGQEARMIPRSEDEFLALVDRHFPARHALAVLGRGDDCAVLAGPERLAVSADLFLEDVHFRRAYFSAGDIGHKALAVNLSDLAAMGAVPLAFTLELMIPADLPDGFWDEFLAGMAALAQKHDVFLAGGDLSRAASLGVDVCVLGKPGPTGRVLARGGCRPGDALFVAGPLGLARAGLLALEAHGPAAKARWPECCAAHLRPAPRLTQGLELAAHPAVRGLMDLSDGLARDLPRLTGAHLGADLDLDAAHLAPELLACAADLGLEALELAVRGGEDYALLGAVAPDGLKALTRDLPWVRPIGKVSAEPGLRLDGRSFLLPGHDHFAAEMPADFRLKPVGRVRSPLKNRDQAPKFEDEGAPRAWIDLDPAYAPALDGLEPGRTILLFTWLHLADRETLAVHPRGNPANPLRGVFDTRSPDRPNPIGLHEVTILEIDGTSLLVGALEALDGTPVMDIKPLARPAGQRG